MAPEKKRQKKEAVAEAAGGEATASKRKVFVEGLPFEMTTEKLCEYVGHLSPNSPAVSCSSVVTVAVAVAVAVTVTVTVSISAS